MRCLCLERLPPPNQGLGKTSQAPHLEKQGVKSRASRHLAHQGNEYRTQLCPVSLWFLHVAAVATHRQLQLLFLKFLFYSSEVSAHKSFELAVFSWRSHVVVGESAKFVLHARSQRLPHLPCLLSSCTAAWEFL